MRSKYYFDKFSNIAQDSCIYGKAFLDEALQRGLPHSRAILMHGHAGQFSLGPMSIEGPNYCSSLMLYILLAKVSK